MWLIRIFQENKPNLNWAVLYEIKPNRRKYILLWRSYTLNDVLTYAFPVTLPNAIGMYKHGFEKHTLPDINKRSSLRERWVQAEA